MTGFQKANRLTEKTHEIEQLIDFLEDINRNIKYSESTLESIVLQYKGGNYKFSEKLALYIKESDFPQAWKKAFYESDSKLDKNERFIFLSLGDKLGTSDLESQEKLISYTVEHFSKELCKSEKDESEKKRLYIVTGIASGLTAAILMI